MFDRYYVDYTYRRMKKVIDHFGHTAFAGATVLDLGCGHGDAGAALARLGATITAVDARQEHINIGKKKYPHINFICSDLDKVWSFGKQKFNFVLNLGLICHLTNFKQILQHSCAVADNLILESEICDSNNPDRIIQVSEQRAIYDWAFNGVGNKPPAILVENILRSAGMVFKRFDDRALNSGNYKYDWKVEDTGHRKIYHRRFWIAQKESNIIVPNPPALEKAPTIQSAISLPPKAQIASPQQEIRSPAASNKPRIAVCISGHLRCFEQTAHSLKINLPDQCEIDYFIHTWDNVGAPLRGFDAKLHRINTHEITPTIKKIYNPKELFIQPKVNFPISEMIRAANHEKRDINAVLSMFYSIKACNQLKINYEEKHKFKYDMVIRIRPDLLFFSKFPIQGRPSPNKLYIPAGADYAGINDQIAFGVSEMMDQYSLIFDNINQILSSGQWFNPEIFTKKHLEILKIHLERPTLKYQIKRAS